MGDLKEHIKNTLSRRQKRVISPDGMHRAAVLLPLLEKKGLPCVVFTKRSDTVAHHKGEISFPGGLMEDGDLSLQETALRESREELGIPQDDVEILGELDDTVTVVTNYHLTAFVGALLRPVRYRISPVEIERVIEVPLAVLKDPAHFKEETWEYENESRPVYFYSYGNDVIWGATARILKHFLDLIS